MFLQNVTWSFIYNDDTATIWYNDQCEATQKFSSWAEAKHCPINSRTNVYTQRKLSTERCKRAVFSWKKNISRVRLNLSGLTSGARKIASHALQHDSVAMQRQRRRYHFRRSSSAHETTVTRNFGRPETEAAFRNDHSADVGHKWRQKVVSLQNNNQLVTGALHARRAL